MARHSRKPADSRGRLVRVKNWQAVEVVRGELERKTGRPVTDGAAVDHALVQAAKYVTSGTIITDEMATTLVYHVVRAVTALLPEGGNPEVTWVPRDGDEAGELVLRYGDRQHTLGPLPHFNTFINGLRNVETTIGATQAGN